MALDENPDEVFDNEPEGGAEGNGDEQSNRSFRLMMIGLFALGGLGVLAIVLALLLRQGGNNQVAQQNAIIQATNEAVIALSQITPTPLPTQTPVPTNTALPPTNTPTVAPSPTTAPTQTPVISETGVLTGTGVLTSTTGSTTKATPAGKATTAAGATAKPATGSQATSVASSSSAAAAATATVAASKNVTSTQPMTGTTGAGGKGLPTTGANDNLFVLLLAAVGLVGVLVVARRLRTS